MVKNTWEENFSIQNYPCMSDIYMSMSEITKSHRTNYAFFAKYFKD